jgi:hypothetical protein
MWLCAKCNHPNKLTISTFSVKLGLNLGYTNYEQYTPASIKWYVQNPWDDDIQP